MALLIILTLSLLLVEAVSLELCLPLLGPGYHPAQHGFTDLCFLGLQYLQIGVLISACYSQLSDLAPQLVHHCLVLLYKQLPQDPLCILYKLINFPLNYQKSLTPFRCPLSCQITL